MSDLKHQGMEVSAAEFLQGSLPVSNDHIHDNRYYTKAEIEEKLKEKDSVKTGILTSGIGVKSFTFNGTANAKVELNFEDLGVDNSFGTSSKPARLDHYHQKLFTGFGFKPVAYDGSKEITLELEKTLFDNEILTNGPGIKDFIYDGTEPASISVDFGEKTELSGSLDIAARIDHKHKSLTAGSGIAALNYDTSETAIVQVAWDNKAENAGTSELVARADHGHATVNKIEGSGEWLADIKLSTNGNNLELTKTFRKSIVEGALTEGGVAFSVGNAQGLVYDYTLHEAFICTTDLDVTDSKKEIEFRGSGIIYDLVKNDIYEFDGSSWKSVEETLRPGRIYANTATKKGFYKFPNKLEQLWDYTGSGEPNEVFICSNKFEVKDSKKAVEKTSSGKVFDLENDITWIWDGFTWSKIPGCELRPNELYVNPVTEKGYFVKLDGTVVSLWSDSGAKLDFAYICENEEDFIDSKEEIEQTLPEEEKRYIYDLQTETVLFFTGSKWITDNSKELQQGKIYANSTTGKGFIYRDEEVKKLWESGKVKPPVFAFICENEEDIWESKRTVEVSEILTEEDSFVYNIENDFVEQWTGSSWITVTKKLRNWTTYVNTVTSKGFFKYPEKVKKLWGDTSKLPITVRKGSLNCSEMQALRDNQVIFGDKFSWFKNGVITVAELTALAKTSPVKFSWLYNGSFTVETLEAQNYKFDKLPNEEATSPITIKHSSITINDLENSKFESIFGSKPAYFEYGSFTSESLKNALNSREIDNIVWGSYSIEILEQLRFKQPPENTPISTTLEEGSLTANKLPSNVYSKGLRVSELAKFLSAEADGVKQGSYTCEDLIVTPESIELEDGTLTTNALPTWVYSKGISVANLPIYLNASADGVQQGTYTCEELTDKETTNSLLTAIVHKGQLNLEKFVDLQNTTVIGTNINNNVKHGSLTVNALQEQKKSNQDWLKDGSFTTEDLDGYITSAPSITTQETKKNFTLNSLVNVNSLKVSDVSKTVPQYSIEELRENDVNAQISVRELSKSTPISLNSSEVKTLKVEQIKTDDLR